MLDINNLGGEIKSDLYDELLNEMRTEEIETERLNEFNEIMKKHMP